MENVIILIKQLLIMTIYCAIGYILHRRKMVTSEGCAAFSTFLIYIILPCVIVSSFLREQTAETTKRLLLSMGLAVLLLALSMAISHILLKRNAIDEFSSSFSNAGFMGIPLISSILGPDAVFLTAGFIALLNILQWIYGSTLLTSEGRGKTSDILKNPLVVSLLIGVVVYFLPFRLPEVLDSCVSSIAKCNSPVAMLILGYYLAELSFKDIFLNKGAYLVSIIRLILIPALSIAVLLFISAIDPEFKLALLIAASCPVGINVAIYAKRAGNDYHRAVTLICQSTVLCLVTLPLVLLLATKVF